MATVPVAKNIPLYSGMYFGNDWNRLSDNTLIDEITEKYCKAFKIDVDQFSASQELAEQVAGLASKEGRTVDEIYELGNEIAEKYDYPYGMSMPAIGSDSMHMPVLARGTPLSHVGIVERITEYAQRLRAEGLHVRNSWEVLGDRSISIINTTNGPMALWEYHAGIRLRKFLDGVSARMNAQMSVESEEKAIALLKTKVKPAQYKCYLLNNAFVEHSKKSDLYYFFRKGLPVIAVSYHKDAGGRVLACLCLHPYGYFEHTHVGVMCPTDEVIAQVLLMRANEHKFWAKSGQWRASDSRSGL